MTRYRRNAAVTATEIEDGVFLVEPDTQEIVFLDAVSGGLWRLLADAQTLDGLQAVVCAAFPDQKRAAVEADVAAALAEMVARRLVLSVP